MREKNIHRLLKLTRDVKLHLRVGAAKFISGSLLRLCTVAEARDVDHGVGFAQLLPQHRFNRAVVSREARLVLNKTAFLLDLDLDRVAERSELLGNTAEEDGGTRLHDEQFVFSHRVTQIRKVLRARRPWVFYLRADPEKMGVG